jgi:hypothetical protein
MDHSKVVGGSTAKRVMSCPGSVALVQKMPPQAGSEHADRGTLLHNVISEVLDKGLPPEHFLGTKYNNQVLTQELIDEKINVALDALDEIDPHKKLEYEVETRVGFGDFLPGVFGSTDLVGRIGRRAIVLDWKFGDGVAVDAVENPQLMFYAAASMRTEAAKWAFEDVDEVECIIVQPPVIKRWVTTKERIQQFEQELLMAVKEAMKPNAALKAGSHCRFCTAKPVCPQMTGAADRAMAVQVKNIDTDQLAVYLQQADLLEDWIKDLRALAFNLLEKNVPVYGYKLVAKQARRKWADEEQARKVLLDMGLKESVVVETSIMSPAQAEKALKKRFSELPEGLIKSESSGTTLASATDPRPAVLQLSGLTAALSKLN